MSITPANKEAIPLRWTPADGRTLPQLRCLFTSGRRQGYLHRVRLAPGAATLLVHAEPSDYRQVVRFYDTVTWRELWNIALPPREPCTNGRPVGVLFLSPDRYVIAHREFLMGVRENVVWRTTPPVPTEWPIESWRQYPNAREWDLVRNGDPRADTDQLYVYAYWVKNLGSSSYFFEPETEGRSAVEILSLDDGKWIRRAEIPCMEAAASVMPAARAPLFNRKHNLVELVRDDVILGVLEALQGRSIVDVDVSYLDRRAIVAMDDAELLFFEIDDGRPLP